MIRVGTDTDKWGKPYDYSFVMLPNGVLTGLTKNPERDDVPAFNLHHVRALKNLIEGDLGRTWKFDRLNHDNERTVKQ